MKKKKSLSNKKTWRRTEWTSDGLEGRWSLNPGPRTWPSSGHPRSQSLLEWPQRIFSFAGSAEYARSLPALVRTHLLNFQSPPLLPPTPLPSPAAPDHNTLIITPDDDTKAPEAISRGRGMRWKGSSVRPRLFSRTLTAQPWDNFRKWNSRGGWEGGVPFTAFQRSLFNPEL